MTNEPQTEESPLGNSTSSYAGSISSSGTEPDPRRRKKRWAPKVKTGCATCRARRVKCDETKPHCKRCTVYGYVCNGYESPASRATATTTTTSSSSSSSSSQNRLADKQKLKSASAERLEFSLNTHLALPEEDFLDSCRFYVEAVLPLRQREIDWKYQKSLNLGNRYRPGFLLSMTAQKISFIGVATNTLPHPDKMPSISGLWSKFHACMVLNIRDINKYLKLGCPHSRVLALLRITDMLGVELSILGTKWRAHNSGFLALLRLDDDTAKKMSSARCLETAKQFHIITAAVTNSTSPASDQVDELNSFTTDEIASIFSKQLYGELPCPTTLFLEIILINKLRVLAASGIPYDTVILPALVEMLTRIDEFVPETWQEPYGVPDEAKFVVLARVFKCSVALYAILTLVPSETSRAPKGWGGWATRRLALRGELLAHMREACSMLESKAAMSWPVAVAAVAVAGGDKEDQDFIVGIFAREKGVQGDAFYVPMFYIEKLRTFWASGRKGWEDLFDKPFAPMA